MKKALAILVLTLMLSLFLVGCSIIKSASDEKTKTSSELNDVIKVSSDIDSIEQELNPSDIEEFQKDLENFDW